MCFPFDAVPPIPAIAGAAIDTEDVTVELLAWITPPPANLTQAAIIARAQQLREARGASFIDDEDVRAAIAALEG